MVREIIVREVSHQGKALGWVAESQLDTELTVISCIALTLSLVTNLSYL